jgi:peptidyl-prolyl cis-trans isomerase SurA
MKLIAGLLLSATLCWCADVSLVEEIIAKVNGDIVTRGELERAYREGEAVLQQQKVTGPQLQQALAEAQKNALRDRIDQLLLAQKGKDLNINVDSELSKYMADLQKNSKIADPEKFQQYIREQSGQSFEDFRSEARNGMLTQRVIRQEVGGKINISRAEQQKYYDEHKNEFVRQERVFLREILVSTENKDAAGVAAAEKKAKDLVARARKGERFPELARDNSDAASARNYGDTGAYKKGEMAPDLENAVWNQPKGYVTDPIRRDNGFLIVKVEEHQKEGQAELSEVENEIMEKLYTPRMQPAVREYLTKLRETAFLEIKPGWTDTGAAAGKDTKWSDPAQLKPETVTKAEVVSKPKHKKLLWAVPIPGTKQKDTSSSK